jgi:hypothetical protein
VIIRKVSKLKNMYDAAAFIVPCRNHVMYQISHRQQPYLTMVDLPGLFYANTTEQSGADIKFIHGKHTVYHHRGYIDEERARSAKSYDAHSEDRPRRKAHSWYDHKAGLTEAWI